MYLRPRYRRSLSAFPQERLLPRWAKVLLAAGAALLALYLAWIVLLRLLGIDNAFVRAGAILTVEERGTVSVTIDEKQQRAENGMVLFPEETVTTGPGAHAMLQFFDDTLLRMDGSTEVWIEESSRGERESALSVDLRSGTVWITTPAAASATGSVARRILAGELQYEIPSGTEAIVSGSALVVFSAEGDGVKVESNDGTTFVVSEGQKWLLPENTQIGSNPYAYRSPLDAAAAQSTFVVESRRAARLFTQNKPSGTGTPASTETLVVTAPLSGALETQPIVVVRGRVSSAVAQVTVNGHPAILDPVSGIFSQEIAPPDGVAEIEVKVQALDAQGGLLAEVRHIVKRPSQPELSAPTITVPARAGQTYRTLKEELVLRGASPPGAAGIVVNDYRLQLFDPARGEWSYIASLRLGNMRIGANTYDVVALDGAGRKSPGARITIIAGEGPEGVVATSPAVSSTPASPSPGPLPNNAPLLPGTLTVTAPTPGTVHVETGTGFLLEGTTSAQTASIWVNDYRLQLYRPGVTRWNYIAEVRLNNLRRGRNVYVIVARNARDEVLDRLEYTVEYEPE